MPHYVFANGNEIASRSADGASIACQPDVCFSPGAPMPGVPVPYANSVFARDLDNLSRTVFIKGTGAALEDRSYFATSYGDEPATHALKKGVISGKIQGKAYFRSWSTDVKFEGLGVARHMDTVTHNHVNQPNAMAQKYRSVWAKAAPCAKDRKAVETHCKEERDPSKKRKRKGLWEKVNNLISFPDAAAKKTLGYRSSGGNKWMEDHCAGLWIKPSTKARAFNDAKTEIEKFLNQDKWTLAEAAFVELLKLANERLDKAWLAWKLAKLFGRSAAKEVVAAFAAGSVIGTPIAAGLTAWTIADVIQTAKEIADAIGPEAGEILKDLQSVDAVEQALKKKLAEWKKSPAKLMAEAMTVLANANLCIRARRCMLVPYDKTDALEAARSGEGCCPGQTGNHVMPGSMFGRKSDGKIDPAFKDACDRVKGFEYNHDDAPTICLEGVNNTHGSHGKAHSLLRGSIDEYKKKQEAAKAAGVAGADPKRISYREARELALDSLKVAAWNCNRKCLRAQLDAYYKKACNKGNNKNLKATSGGGRKPDATTPQPDDSY
ncbi:PAAR-like domain-containing protein [Sorangium sp. So ce1024]|uniref:PAAR-like domain-containing protein n=1 Tax=Sorangium sp. So ce1024 TaxID=3133327 RepID=UPI003F022328